MDYGAHKSEPSFQTVETGFQPTPDLLRVEAKVDRIIQLLQKMQGGTNETEF